MHLPVANDPLARRYILSHKRYTFSRSTARILTQTIRMFMTMKKTPYYTAALLMICASPLWASDRLVHQWTDAHGQVHYGDAQAAFGQKNARPVKVTRPISTVHNDHPIQYQPNFSEAKSSTKRRRSNSTRYLTNHSKWSTAQCDTLRDQIDQTRQIQPLRRQWENDYAQHCIHGHYYGNSK